MTIAEAKQLRIVDYLARLGHRPRNIKSDQYWYFSPLRDERTPSFKVNDRLNEWYDFGAATGGDLVELGKHLYQTDSVSEVLAYIGKHENAIPIQRVRIPGTTPRPVEADMKDVLVVPLQHHALLSYGVRNPCYKGCIRCKDISVIRHSHSEAQNRVCVFEGFMDFLSYLTLKQTGDDTVCNGAPCDYLGMN